MYRRLYNSEEAASISLSDHDGDTRAPVNDHDMTDLGTLLQWSPSVRPLASDKQMTPIHSPTREHKGTAEAVSPSMCVVKKEPGLRNHAEYKVDVNKTFKNVSKQCATLHRYDRNKSVWVLSNLNVDAINIADSIVQSTPNAKGVLAGCFAGEYKGVVPALIDFKTGMTTEAYEVIMLLFTSQYVRVQN